MVLKHSRHHVKRRDKEVASNRAQMLPYLNYTTRYSLLLGKNGTSTHLSWLTNYTTSLIPLWFLSHLISMTSCLLSSYFLFQSPASTSWVMIWKETSAVRGAMHAKKTHPHTHTHIVHLRQNEHADCIFGSVRTSSLMRVRTACFSASVMQIESRTWLPVFCTSLPPDLFFSVQGSLYCWGQNKNHSSCASFVTVHSAM